MVDIAKLAIEVDASQATAAAGQLKTFGAEATKADKAATGVGRASADAGKEAGNSAYKYRMAAMQLSQVASQGSVTGNYIQALAIQLPDLAMGLGTVGIVAGALAGALAMPLINALRGASTSIDDLKADLDALSGSFDIASDGSYKLSEELARLAVISEEAAKLKVAVETESARKNLLNLGSSMREAFSDLTGGIILSAAEKLNGVTFTDKLAANLRITKEEAEQLRSALAGAVQSQDPKKYGEFANVIESLTKTYGRNNSAVTELASGMAEFIEAGARAADNYKMLTAAGTDWESLLQRTNETMAEGMDFGPSSADYYAEQLRLLKETNAEQLRADDARLASRASALKAIEAIEVQQMTNLERLTDNYLTQRSQISAALGDGVIAVEEANALKLASDQQYAAASQQIADQQTQAQLAAYATTLSAMQGFSSAALAAVEAYGEESSDLGKGLLLASKVLSVAQAVMAAELSAVMTRAAYASAAMFAGPGAPAVLAAGEAAAQFNRGLGYASAALIAATEFAPARALGGQVQAGTSYLVGERGPELVTMGANGYVTPNDKLGGKSAPVINVIEDASKAGAQEVQQMGEQDIINIFVSNIQRGGAAARAMQGAYGLRRAAR